MAAPVRSSAATTSASRWSSSVLCSSNSAAYLGGKGLGGFFGSLCLGLDTGAVLLCFGDHRLCSGLRIRLDRGTLGERLRKHLLGFGFESCCVLFGGFSDLGASLVEAGQNRLHAFFRVRDQFAGVALRGGDLAGGLETVLVRLIPRPSSSLLDRSWPIPRIGR